MLAIGARPPGATMSEAPATPASATSASGALGAATARLEGGAVLVVLAAREGLDPGAVDVAVAARAVRFAAVGGEALELALPAAVDAEAAAPARLSRRRRELALRLPVVGSVAS